MNIITVIPLSKSKVAEELIYFTANEVPIGAVVTVPLRRKNIFAIVTKIEPVQDLKTDIKNASFKIRKLDKIKSTIFFPTFFVEACKNIAEFHSTKIGAVIDTVISNLILENIGNIDPPIPPQASFEINSNTDNTNRKNSNNRIFAIQGDDTDRISSWRSLIRQEFANKKSVAIYVPTIEDGKLLFSALEKGIEGYIFFLNNSLSSKKFISTWKNISEIDHPIVIICTSSFSLLPRTDLKTVIIEKENGKGWISQKSPYLDLRNAITTIAKLNNQIIYLSDSMLRTETLNDVEKEMIEEGSPFKWRSISLAKDLLVDMRTTKDQTKESRFKVLSTELKDLITQNAEENTHLFIFSLRRGLAPITACSDCGNIVMCRQCKSTVVLHTSQETGKNYFMCHICGDRRSAEENCLTCNSWKLTPLGIGIEKVYEEIKNNFPKIDIFKIDSDSIKTEKQLTEILAKFRAKPGSILLGTELAIQNFSEKIDHIAISSMDSLFSLPDFRIQEKIMYNLIRLRAQATRSILVQTRKIEEKVFEYGLKGNISDFYRMTLDERRNFNYPPFSILIKITIEGKKDEIANTMADVAKFLEPQTIDIFPAFTSTVRGKSVIHGLIKIATHAWPDPELSDKLRSLPPNVMVKINPESLL